MSAGDSARRWGRARPSCDPSRRGVVGARGFAGDAGRPYTPGTRCQRSRRRGGDGGMAGSVRQVQRGRGGGWRLAGEAASGRECPSRRTHRGRRRAGRYFPGEAILNFMAGRCGRPVLLGMGGGGGKGALSLRGRRAAGLSWGARAGGVVPAALGGGGGGGGWMEEAGRPSSRSARPLLKYSKKGRCDPHCPASNRAAPAAAFHPTERRPGLDAGDTCPIPEVAR